MSAADQNILNVCANVRQSFSVLEAFAEKHNISITGAIYFAMVGALNIQRDETGFVHFRQMKPLQIARQINVDSKKVARWCSTLADAGLLSRKRGSYAVENVAEWYLVAGIFTRLSQSDNVSLGTTEPFGQKQREVADASGSSAFSVEPSLTHVSL